MNYKIVLLAIALLSCSGAFSQPFAFVELFTSEGCHSCPPAEKLLSELKSDAEKNKKNIFFLQFHVDYWNRLGWKDPFSSFQFTNRQKNYTSALNEESLYTPMMVVNGKTAFAGSDTEKAKTAIKSALSGSQMQPLEIRMDSLERDTLYLHYKSSVAGKNYFVRAAVTQDNVSSSISKGENAGKTLVHDAVVRAFASGDQKPSGQLKIPLKKFSPDKNCSLVVFVQQKQTMEIVSAVAIGFEE